MFHTGIVYEGQIVIIETDHNGRRVTVASEPRLESFADADTFLAVHSFRRSVAWELGSAGSVHAVLEKIDNRFNGTVAARIWDAVGTTHEQFAPMSARELVCRETGDLISDLEVTEVYVVAGSSLDGDVAKIHMVREGGTWEERYSTDFDPDQTVMVAKRKA